MSSYSQLKTRLLSGLRGSNTGCSRAQTELGKRCEERTKRGRGDALAERAREHLHAQHLGIGSHLLAHDAHRLIDVVHRHHGDARLIQVGIGERDGQQLIVCLPAQARGFLRRAIVLGQAIGIADDLLGLAVPMLALLHGALQHRVVEECVALRDRGLDGKHLAVELGQQYVGKHVNALHASSFWRERRPPTS